MADEHTTPTRDMNKEEDNKRDDDLVLHEQSTIPSPTKGNKSKKQSNKRKSTPAKEKEGKRERDNNSPPVPIE